MLTKKISFWLVVALLLGWGALSLLLIQSSKELLQAQLQYEGTSVAFPKGVKLDLQVDKKVYAAGETVLISLRNDSRKDVWVSERADGCVADWWQLERQIDEDSWAMVAIQRAECVTTSFGLVSFPRHSLLTDTWNGLAQTEALGTTFETVPTGTYRVRVPFLHGLEPTEADWLAQDVIAALSDSFTYGVEENQP